MAGKAGVRLLPTPVVSFTDIRVGDPNAPDIQMERFRAEVELTPLLKGEVRIIQMVVDRPQFRIDIARLAGSEVEQEGGWKLDSERISLERLQIVGGSASIRDSRTGRSWKADSIDAVVEADTLRGPAKVEGAFLLDGKQIALSVGLGRMAGGSIATKLAVQSPDYPFNLSLDGTYHFPGTAPAKFDGFAVVEGKPPLDESSPRTQWSDFRASGKVVLVPTNLQVEEAQISYGATERPLILEASGEIDFGDAPRFDLTVGARQIDLDRTLGGGTEAPVSIEAAMAALIEAVPRAELPPIPGELHLEAQGVVVGGGVLQAVGVDLATAEGGWQVENFTAMLPGETRIDLDGMLDISPAAAFNGHGRLQSKRPAAFASWWRGDVGSAARIGRFDIEADLALAPEGQHLSTIVARTGAGTVTGAVDIRRFPQSEQLFVTVDLNADRADLVEARALAELVAGKTIAAGRIDQMTLSLSADVLTAGGVEARSVAVEGGLEGGELNLRRLSVADLAGTRIETLGSIRDPFGKPSGNIEASISATDFRGATEFLASFAPENNIVRHLQEVAPILSPVNAEVSAEGGAAGERLALSLTGSFADTHVTLEAEGKGSLDDLASLSGKVALHADGEDSADVLRQIGLHPLQVRSTPLNVDASFEGDLASAGKLSLKGMIAGVDLAYEAETSIRDGHIALVGEVDAESANIDPLLLLSGVAVPGVGEGHAASAAGRLEYAAGDASLALESATFAGQAVEGALQATIAPDDPKVSGTLDVEEASLPFLVGMVAGTKPGIGEAGRWADTPFVAILPAKMAMNLALSTKRLDVGTEMAASDARLDISLNSGVLNVDVTEATFAGGALKGAVSATLYEGEVEASVSGSLQGAELQLLAWEQAGLPAASGQLDVSLEAVGRGRSMAGIISALGGSGSFSIEEGRLNGLNPEALAIVMGAAEGEREPSESEARETFAREFGSGELEFGRAAGSFSIADGVMTIPTVSLAGSATAILADATFDLNALTLASDWVVRSVGVGNEEAQPFVQVRFTGPMASPQRTVDLDPLLNRLRSRFLQRQLAELEVLEAERQRVEAEQDQVKAERARSEAARDAAAEQRDREASLSAPAPAPAAESSTPAEAAPSAIETLPPTPEPDPLISPAPAPALAPAPAIEPAPAPTIQPSPDPSAVEAGPDLPPPEVTPIDPASEAAPAIEPVRPSRPRRTTRPAAPAPVVPAPITPRQSFESEYRVLPNGTIVKIR